MPSSYTPLLRLTLPADGELVGTWGQTVNNGITSLEEAAIAGTASIALVDADFVLSTANGAPDSARNAVIRLTGALTAQRNVVCPSSSKLYVVRNSTTGGFGINFKTAAGAGVVVPPGGLLLLYCDGVDVIESTTGSGVFVKKSGDTMTGLLDIITVPQRIAVFRTSDASSGYVVFGSNGADRAYMGSGPSVIGAMAVADFGLVTAGGSLWLGVPGPAPMIFAINGAERMRIDATGNVGIGTSVTGRRFNVSANSQTTAIPVDINDERGDTAVSLSVLFTRQTVLVGTISTTTTATAYNTTSDYRLKDAVEDLVDSGGFIDALRPRRFLWKESGARAAGFIAHEFAEVSPSSVTGEKDGEAVQTLDASTPEMMANIIAELQSLRQRVAALGG